MWWRRRTATSHRRAGGRTVKGARLVWLNGRRRSPPGWECDGLGSAMRSLIKTAGPYLWRYRRGLGLGMGALVIKDLLAVTLPLVIRSGVDSLTRGFRIGLVFEFAGLLVILSLIMGIFQYWMRVILIGISRDVEYDLRIDLFS